MDSNNRIAATLYFVGTQFVSRNIIINTLHKGDDDNNNNNNNNKQKTAQVIPIVISSTGVIPKSLSQSQYYHRV